MKIVYACKVGYSDQDDEGAIEHALRVLGHEVFRVDENADDFPDGDLLLFHKPSASSRLVTQLRQLGERMPTVCWYFDRVREHGNSILNRRTNGRLEWMGAVQPNVQHLFCTDGDWVDECEDQMRAGYTKATVHWLRQGADERWWAWPLQRSVRHLGKVLLTCNTAGPRKEFVVALKTALRGGLMHHERGVYGWNLVTACQAARCVVAPPTPVTNRYCSNRIYTVLAAGGVLVHPATRAVEDDYKAGFDFLEYNGVDAAQGTQELVRLLTSGHTFPQEMGVRGRETTWQKNLYRHRLEVLLRTTSGKASEKYGTQHSGKAA